MDDLSDVPGSELVSKGSLCVIFPKDEEKEFDVGYALAQITDVRAYSSDSIIVERISTGRTDSFDTHWGDIGILVPFNSTLRHDRKESNPEDDVKPGMQVLTLYMNEDGSFPPVYFPAMLTENEPTTSKVSVVSKFGGQKFDMMVDVCGHYVPSVILKVSAHTSRPLRSIMKRLKRKHEKENRKKHKEIAQEHTLPERGSIHLVKLHSADNHAEPEITPTTFLAQTQKFCEQTEVTINTLTHELERSRQKFDKLVREYKTLKLRYQQQTADAEETKNSNRKISKDYLELNERHLEKIAELRQVATNYDLLYNAMKKMKAEKETVEEDFLEVEKKLAQDNYRKSITATQSAKLWQLASKRYPTLQKEKFMHDESGLDVVNLLISLLEKDLHPPKSSGVPIRTMPAMRSVQQVKHAKLSGITFASHEVKDDGSTSPIPHTATDQLQSEPPPPPPDDYSDGSSEVDDGDYDHDELGSPDARYESQEVIYMAFGGKSDDLDQLKKISANSGISFKFAMEYNSEQWKLNKRMAKDRFDIEIDERITFFRVHAKQRLISYFKNYDELLTWKQRCVQ